jgi:hypothetical protein
MPTAQYKKGGTQAKMYIMRTTGKSSISLPVDGSSKADAIHKNVVDPIKWVGAFKRTLQCVYGKKKGFAHHGSSLYTMLDDVFVPGVTLYDVGVETMTWCLQTLGIHIPVVTTTLELAVPRLDSPSVWMADLGVATECDTYLGGEKAIKAYIQREDFCRRGLTVDYQRFFYKCMDRNTGKMVGADATVSVLDPILRYGRDEAILNIAASNSSVGVYI